MGLGCHLPTHPKSASILCLVLGIGLAVLLVLLTPSKTL